MRGAMATALLLLLGLCSVSLSNASALPSDGLNQKSLDFTSGRLRHRSLLQTPPPAVTATPPAVTATPPAVTATPPAVTATPPAVTATPPAVTATPPRTPPVSGPVPPTVTPAPAPILPPSPPPRAPPAPPTPTRVYLMWVGIGAFILVLASVAVFCLCRKFGENKINRGQRLPPLPRYH